MSLRNRPQTTVHVRAPEQGSELDRLLRRLASHQKMRATGRPVEVETFLDAKPDIKKEQAERIRKEAAEEKAWKEAAEEKARKEAVATIVRLEEKLRLLLLEKDRLVKSHANELRTVRMSIEEIQGAIAEQRRSGRHAQLLS